MKYTEYTKQRQEEFNKLPIFWAFSNKQFREALEKAGIKVGEGDEALQRTARKHCYKFGMGGFYLKKDAEAIREYFKRDRNKELRDMMEKDLKFAREAIEYEMFNHEYAINYEGDFDVVSCFGHVEYDEGKPGTLYMKDLGFSEAVIKVYYDAANYVLANSDF